MHIDDTVQKKQRWVYHTANASLAELYLETPSSLTIMKCRPATLLSQQVNPQSPSLFPLSYAPKLH